MKPGMYVRVWQSNKIKPHERINLNDFVFHRRPPVIEHVPWKFSKKGVEYPVFANIDDRGYTSEKVVFYRRGGEFEYQKILMTHVTHNKYVANIPADFITERGLEYYISAYVDSTLEIKSPDSVINGFQKPYYNIQVRFHTAGPKDKTPNRKYDIISFPVALDNTSASAILPTNYDINKRRLWRSIGGRKYEYNTTPNKDNLFALKPGNAFWFITQNQIPISVGPGYSVPTDSNFTLSLDHG